MFSQVLNQIRVNHPDSIDMHRLFMAAIEGMVRATDPHSFVIQAVRLDPAKEQAYQDGRLWPVPVSFHYVGGSPVVLSVAPGSQAARSDILPGDELIAADGKPISAESPIELDVSLAGAKETPVTLTLQRRHLDGSLVNLNRLVRREKPEDGTALPAAFMLDSVTGYVRVTTFVNDRVADDLHSALGRLEAMGMRRLLLDLRDNGGGRVDQAARVAGEFLPTGALVYTAEGKKEGVTDTVRVSRSFWKREKRYPIVLIVNQGTASASELVAGALQDHDRALIAGKPTFGKALLMYGFPLTDGSIIYLVVGHVKTPCGRVIQRQYRTISSREYYRLALADRDTVGRPTCRTDNGRLVYGGGGIYPDVVLDEPADPVWLARLREADFVATWVGGYSDANASFVSSPGAISAGIALSPGALADFRTFAAHQGVSIPPGPETDVILQRVLVTSLARAKFGDEGFFKAEALLDPEVRAAAGVFQRAGSIDVNHN